ncbi:hypothetical protein CDAR_218891 [Caerostris darwini]|uniref:Uncharacterized protein n=1 Tax=Caerostris darwini TaxID=1538125 RepID=A0AAV4VQW7_9ARAC|nr:hypothetical protein CDAR_218891 [Caerostris darwini]
MLGSRKNRIWCIRFLTTNVSEIWILVRSVNASDGDRWIVERHHPLNPPAAVLMRAPESLRAARLLHDALAREGENRKVAVITGEIPQPMCSNG